MKTLRRNCLSASRSPGFEPFLDKHDVLAGEDWEVRLRRLIETAATVVYVLSLDAVESERCAWEIKQTTELKKRLLPVVWRRVEETRVPASLRQLNYIFFDRPNGFASALRQLTDALNTDIEWVREHARLQELALRWDSRARSDALLLRGEELAAAKAWLRSPPKFAPEPTLLHHDFIKSAVEAEQRRNSLESRRLEQIAAAQAERERALEREKNALRRAQFAARAFVAAAFLLICVVVGSVAWYRQLFILQQYTWYLRMKPSVLTAAEERRIATLPGSEFKDCGNGCPTMVVIPPGKFTMGSPDDEVGRFPDEGPLHEVAIPAPVAVAKFDLTFAEWDVCAAAKACRVVGDSDFGRGTQPVINVSWNDATTYVKWLARTTGKPYRLLSESEFEYAARAGSKPTFPWGDSVGEGNASCKDCGGPAPRGPLPVGSFKANAFGLHDMHGNVRKWVQDLYHPSYSGAPSDGSPWIDGETTRRVYRGGSWWGTHRFIRSAWRGHNQPNAADTLMGIRIARTLTVN